MIDFDFVSPTKIYFGKGQLNSLGNVISDYGKKVLLVYGGGSIKKTGVYDIVCSQLKQMKIQIYELSGIEPNPKIDSVRKGIAVCKQESIEAVIAVGGGSVIDAAKFIAAGACVDFDVWDFISKKSPVQNVLPVFSVLTISATGSEMDNTAVLNNPETMEKLALIDDKLFPAASFCDPTLTYTVSPYQTACGSADIFSHIIEVYFNRNQDLYMLDTQMEGMLKTVIKYAPVAMAEPDNYDARANLMWTSTWAINGYIYGCKKAPWSCHPMEHQLSAVYDITHGLGLAILIPHWMEYVLDDSTVQKFYDFAVNVCGITPAEDKMLTAKMGIEFVKDFLYNKLNLKRSLSEIDIDDTNFVSMAEKACGANGYIDGWKKLYPKDVLAIYKSAL